MFRTSLAFAILLALSACAPQGGVGTLNNGAAIDPASPVASSHVSQPTPSLPLSHEVGGINGGGGGTLPAKPIAVEDVREVIRQGKANLLTLVNEMSYAYDPLKMSVVDKLLWGGNQTLKDVLLNYDVEINDNGPCKDATRKEVDGSMYASKPNAVCISAARIAPKLVAETSKKEILALVMHELSHKLGLDEKAAVLIQERFAYELSDDLMNSVSSDEFLKEAKDVSGRFSSLLIGDISKMSDLELKKHLDVLCEASLDFDSKLYLAPRFLLDRRENDFYRYLSQQLGTLSMYVTSLHNSVAKAELDKKFGSKNTITFAEAVASDGPLENMYATLPITRPTSLDDAKAKLRDLSSRLLQYTGIAEEIHDWGQATRITLPPASRNPFEKFVGAYSVVSSKCTQDTPESMKSFEIIHDSTDVNGPHLRDAGSGYTGDEGGLYDGAFVHMPGYVTVVGDATSATRITDSGDRWGSNISQGFTHDERKVEAVNGGFRFTRTWMSRKFEARTWTDKFGSCAYELKKN